MSDQRAKVDEYGRCCGRKPIVYKRDGHSFCPRCDKAFDLTSGQQVSNWAWKIEGDQARRMMPALRERSEQEPGR